MNAGETGELIEKTMAWTLSASKAIATSGGVPAGVLHLFPKDLLTLLVTNNIELTYTGRILTETLAKPQSGLVTKRPAVVDEVDDI